MSQTPDPLTSLIARLGRAGRLGRDLAFRLDLLRSTGLRHVVRRLRYDAELARIDSAAGPFRAMWLDAAREIGAELVDLPADFLEIRRGDRRTRVRHHWVMLDDIVTVQFALEKVLVQELLSAAGLPIPEFLEFDAADLATATAFLDRGPVPCVVKPVGSSGGASVTSGIRSATDLKRARLRASRMDSRLMIERQAHGDFYRFLFLDGKLLDVIRRLPPRVTGDGRSTVDELIAAENVRRVARRHEVLLRPLRVDLDCILTLEAAGLRLSSILPPGQTIVVKTVVSQNTIGDNETIRDQIAPELVDEARLAAELVGLRLAGVDIMTPDLTEPMRASGGVILEVNGTPGLHYHYEVADRTHATRVAVPVLETLLQ